MIENIYLKLQDERTFDSNLTLYLLDLPSEDQLRKTKISNNLLSSNSVFIIGRGYDDGIKIGASFNAIFPRKNPVDGIKTEAIIKYISVNPTYEIDYLPKGYSGLCLIEFTNEIPVFLNKLTIYGEKKDLMHNDTLILTQQGAFEKVLEKFKNGISI
jgi:hypothetical protein